jgi:hypothetical protein
MLGKRILPLLSAVSGVTGGAIGSTKGAIIGGAASYLLNIGANIATDWKPKMFGDWYSTQIAKLLKKTNNQ